MDLPITRPTQTSYGDQIDFNKLLTKLESIRFNGFLRVTSGDSEGYILLKNGVQRASSFDDYAKSEALEKIESTVHDSKTLIEVFDVKESHMDYLMDLNKFFVIDSDSKVENILHDLKKNEKEPDNPPSTTLDELKSEVNIDKTSKIEIEKEADTEIDEETISEEKEEEIQGEIEELDDTIKENESWKDKGHPLDENSDLKDSSTSGEEEKIRIPATEGINSNDNNEIDEPNALSEELKEPSFGAENIDRMDLMKKYGLKDVEEKEVDDILESYRGGILTDEDVERIELTLMNKIKKSILGIPKIKGTEVMVFLDNTSELSGMVSVITEYESRGLFSRIRGESKDIKDIKRQITNITQIEIQKSFRGYPEIMDNIEINVEIS